MAEEGKAVAGAVRAESKTTGAPMACSSMKFTAKT